MSFFQDIFTRAYSLKTPRRPLSIFLTPFPPLLIMYLFTHTFHPTLPLLLLPPHAPLYPPPQALHPPLSYAINPSYPTDKWR